MARPLIIAMKGHPGSGKSTLARRISACLCCPLLDKDDVLDATEALALVPQSILNDISYTVLWRLAETQLLVAALAAVVVDSPLSSHVHLHCLLDIARRASGRVLVIECRPSDEAEWKRRLEERGRKGEGDDRRGWHKPKTWQDLQKLLHGYGGRADYDIGEVPRLVVDTTPQTKNIKEHGIEEMVSGIMEFIRSNANGN